MKLKKEAGEVQFFEFIHRRPVCPFPESRCRVDIVHCPTVDSLLVWSDPCRLRWCQSLVLEVFFEGLGQREPLDLLQPVPTQRHAGGTSTQVHQRQGLSWGEARTQRSGKLVSYVTTRLHWLCMHVGHAKQTVTVFIYISGSTELLVYVLIHLPSICINEVTDPEGCEKLY